MLATQQKAQIKPRFEELRRKLKGLVGARNDFERPELGNKRDWKRIAEMITNPDLDKTGRMKPLQYPDCFVCEVLEKKCFIWDGNAEHNECPELMFDGFCYADPKNDPNDFAHAGLFKRATMHKRCLKRIALKLGENVESKPDKDITRYCKHYCSKYGKCLAKKSLYEQYLFCEEVLEEALSESIQDVDEIIEVCSR